MLPLLLILLGFLVVLVVATMLRVLLFGVALVTAAAFALGVHNLLQMFTR